MSIRDMEHEIAGLTDRAARDELCVEDLSQSTFGIVDAGIAGGMLGTGIINFPQSASMGTNAVKRRVTVVEGKVEARPIMFTSLTYDHRLVDGREAVTFLCNVRDKLQDPARMLLDV
ncbi:DLST [Symbiodinium sp. CCMP2456]|nr:DLST [Symbiodinium sp. CCMP2456]